MMTIPLVLPRGKYGMKDGRRSFFNPKISKHLARHMPEIAAHINVIERCEKYSNGKLTKTFVLIFATALWIIRKPCLLKLVNICCMNCTRTWTLCEVSLSECDGIHLPIIPFYQLKTQDDGRKAALLTWSVNYKSIGVKIIDNGTKKVSNYFLLNISNKEQILINNSEWRHWFMFDGVIMHNEMEELTKFMRGKTYAP